MARAANKIEAVTVLDDIAFEPVDLEGFKEWANITFDEADNVLEACLISARQLIEAASGKSLGPKRLEVVFSHNGYKAITLPRGPVKELCAVSFTNCDCRQYDDCLVTDDYCLQADSFKGPDGYYKVIYKAGADEQPEAVLSAIKAQALYLYENRGDSSRSGLSGMALTLIQPYMKLA